MAETNTITKTCRKCGVDQAPELFNKDKTRPDGRFPWCKTCSSADQKKVYQKDLTKARAHRKADYQKNKEAYIARAKDWAEQNKDRRCEISKAYVKRNPEKRSQTQRQNWERDPGRYAAHYKARQQRKRQAMPSWANEESIKAMYRQCAWVTMVTGVKHHVDHYYPLKNDLVCGLHVENNLRIISAFDNLSKGNKLPK